MYTARRTVILFSMALMVLFLGWLILFQDNEWLRALGASIFPSVGGMVSFIVLFRAFRTINDKLRYFFLFISIGVFCFMVSNALWLLYQLIERTSDLPAPFLLISTMGYFFFLVGLIYFTRTFGHTFFHNPYLFNILVFMIGAAVLSYHFLIGPNMDFSKGVGLLSSISLSLPFIDLTIFFVTICLHYLTLNRIKGKLIWLLISAFYVQIAADSLFAYQLMNNSYYPGNVVDLLYLSSIMIMGLTGLFAQDLTDAYGHDWHAEAANSITKESIFPLLSIIILILLALVTNEWRLNALELGLTLIFLITVARHIFMLKNNQHLLSEYQLLAYFDPLTGLKNRTSFNKDLKKVMEFAKQNEQKIAVLLIDLDRFKNINDSFGHDFGDQLLKISADRLKRTIGENGQIYRLGGDEFAIILPESNETNAQNAAEGIIISFISPYIIGEHEIIISPSIGISMYPNKGDNGGILLRNADAAMYLAKARGRNSYQFFNTELNEAMSRKWRLENDLRKAIEKNELELYYQPIIELGSNKIKGMEALLRWNHTKMGPISPVEFIPIAEESGQIVEIGEWVLKNACLQNKIWQELGLPSLYVAVNVSVRQFRHNEFVKRVRNILKETGLNPKYLEVEITESIMQDVKESIQVLNELRDLGVKTAIDDFGTGYSSLYILKNLPIDTIKIDKSFIDAVTSSDSLVKTIIEIGLNLELSVVAEGIEDERQAAVLAEYKCGLGQGYLFSRPLNMGAFTQFLSEWQMQGNFIEKSAG